MISDDLKACLPVLELLSKIKSKQLREKFLKDQFKNSDKIYKAIKEIIANLVHKNIPLEVDQKKKLQRHRKKIISFVNDKSKTRRKSHIIQSGGYLPIILPTVLSLLSSFLNG